MRMVNPLGGYPCLIQTEQLINLVTLSVLLLALLDYDRGLAIPSQSISLFIRSFSAKLPCSRSLNVDIHHQIKRHRAVYCDADPVPPIVQLSCA